MVAKIMWDSDPSETSYLTTGLNSLGDGANKLGGAIASNLDTHIDIHVYIAAQASARDTGAYISCYLIPSTDGGTTYAYGGDSLDPDPGLWLCDFVFDAATTARDAMRSRLPIPPGYFKLLFMNETGQALASSGNTVEYRVYSLETQ